jgi:membrane protease YdiL (CAAX protease family)
MAVKLTATVGILILLVQLFMFVNLSYFYGPYAEAVRPVFLAYFILLAILSPFVIRVLLQIAQPQELGNFAIGFILTAVVVFVVPTIIAGAVSVETLKLAVGFGFLHAFIKAFDEEIIFRGVLPKLLAKGHVFLGLNWGDVIASVLFGVFHLAVSGASIPAMLFLMVLGLVWCLVRNKLSLMGSAGSHFAYNLMALGVLPKLIGGV